MHNASLGATVLSLGLLVSGCETYHVRAAAQAAPLPTVSSDANSTRPVVTIATNFPAENKSENVAVPVQAPVPAPAPVAATVVAPVVATTNAPVEAQPVRPALYVVKEGDTLSEIAERYLDGASHWPEIVAVNPGLVPERLRTGRTIRLPAVEAAK